MSWNSIRRRRRWRKSHLWRNLAFDTDFCWKNTYTLLSKKHLFLAHTRSLDESKLCEEEPWSNFTSWRPTPSILLLFLCTLLAPPPLAGRCESSIHTRGEGGRREGRGYDADLAYIYTQKTKRKMEEGTFLCSTLRVRASTYVGVGEKKNDYACVENWGNISLHFLTYTVTKAILSYAVPEASQFQFSEK